MPSNRRYFLRQAGATGASLLFSTTVRAAPKQSLPTLHPSMSLGMGSYDKPGVFCCFSSPSLIGSPHGKKFDFLSIIYHNGG